MPDFLVCTSSDKPDPDFIAKELIKQAISFLLLLVNFRLIYVLIKKPKVFSNVFFKLVIINTCASCICHFGFYSTGIYPTLLYLFGVELSILNDWSRWICLMIFLMYSSAVCTFIGNLLMGLNRMSSIIGIQIFDWDRHFKLIFAGYLILPSALFFQFAFSEAKILCYKDDGHLIGFDYDFMFWNPNMFSHLKIALLADFTLLPLSFIVNLITIVYFWQRRSEGAEAKKTVEKYATNLLLISLGDFICHTLWALTDVFLFIVIHTEIDVRFLDKPYGIIVQLVQFTPLLPGFWTMLCSKKIRSEIFSFGSSVVSISPSQLPAQLNNQRSTMESRGPAKLSIPL